MLGNTRMILMTVTLVAAALGDQALCQAQDTLPSAPVPFVAPPVPGMPPPPPPPPSAGPFPTLAAPVFVPGDSGAVPAPPPPGGLVPPPSGGYFPNPNGPLLRGDPLLDQPNAPPPGWFSNLEIGLIGPHLSTHLTSSVTVNAQPSFIDQVQLPTATLEWVGSPRIDIGYRLPEGLGEFVFSYRSVVSDGRAILTDFPGQGDNSFLKSRFNMNVFDLVYGSREYSLGPPWDLNWKIGARIAGVYFDSRAEGTFLGAGLAQGESSNFVGAGPLAGVEVARRFDAAPGIAVFGRLEGAALVGRVHQGFEETVDLTPLGGNVLGGASTSSSTQVVPVLALQIGMSYTPPWTGRWNRLAFGYEFQQYWNVGQTGASKANLSTNGVFFRAELGF